MTAPKGADVPEVTAILPTKETIDLITRKVLRQRNLKVVVVAAKFEGALNENHPIRTKPPKQSGFSRGTIMIRLPSSPTFLKFQLFRKRENFNYTNFPAPHWSVTLTFEVIPTNVTLEESSKVGKIYFTKFYHLGGNARPESHRTMTQVGGAPTSH